MCGTTCGKKPFMRKGPFEPDTPPPEKRRPNICVGWQNHCRCPRCETIAVGSGSVGVVTPAYVSRGHGEDKNKRSRADVSPIDISKFQK